MVYDLRYQPFRSLYLAYQVFSTAFVRFPWWIFASVPPFMRPRSSWSLSRCVHVKLLRHLSYVLSRVGEIRRNLPDHTALLKGTKALWIDPVPDLILGRIKAAAVAAQVQPARIPGYWLDNEGSDVPIGEHPSPEEKVVYHIHGGGFIALSANPRDPTASICRGLLQHGKGIRRVFSIEYRLSKASPYVLANPFPAALLDALAGYNYLVNVVGFSPSHIIIEGDSAGGNIALALTRYLVEYRASDVGLPAPPGRLLLLSPWTDLGTSHESRNSSWYTLQHTDYLLPDETDDIPYKKRAYLGPFGMGAGELNPYISPASLNPGVGRVSFEDFPSTFIAAGGAERLLDQIRTLKDRMVRDLSDGKVTYFEPPDAVHDFLVFDSDDESERIETLKAIEKWMSAA